MVRIMTVPEGCPVCGHDVKGCEEYRFFCKPCNLLFRHAELARPNPRPPVPQPEAAPAGIETGPDSDTNEPDLDKIGHLFS